jgi:hypothetical protein
MPKTKETITVLHQSLFNEFRVGDTLQTSLGMTGSKKSVISKLDKSKCLIYVRPATKFWMAWCKLKGLFL